MLMTMYTLGVYRKHNNIYAQYYVRYELQLTIDNLPVDTPDNQTPNSIVRDIHNILQFNILAGSLFIWQRMKLFKG